MILYRHRGLNGTHVDLPSELVGYRSHVDDTAICHGGDEVGHVVGLCSPLLWQGAREGLDWMETDDGWEVADDERPFNPMDHLRQRSPFGVVMVEDVAGRTWCAPSILGPTGDRAFPVTYGGKDFLPQLTSHQNKALTIAQESRLLLIEAVKNDTPLRGEQIVPWAAWALTQTHHLSVPTIGNLGLIDEVLAQRVIAVMAGVVR